MTVLGRRGPLQAAFTIKELREQLQLPGVAATWEGFDYRELEPLLPGESVGRTVRPGMLGGAVSLALT